MPFSAKSFSMSFGYSVDLRLPRGDAVLHELADRVANRDLLGRELEVHLG